MVVSDMENYPGGSARSFTLMCVGARGQSKDAGFLGPWLVLWSCHTALVFAVLSAVVLRRRARRARTTDRGDVDPVIRV